MQSRNGCFKCWKIKSTMEFSSVFLFIRISVNMVLVRDGGNSVSQGFVFDYFWKIVKNNQRPNWSGNLSTSVMWGQILHANNGKIGKKHLFASIQCTGSALGGSQQNSLEKAHLEQFQTFYTAVTQRAVNKDCHVALDYHNELCLSCPKKIFTTYSYVFIRQIQSGFSFSPEKLAHRKGKDWQSRTGSCIGRRSRSWRFGDGKTGSRKDQP